MIRSQSVEEPVTDNGVNAQSSELVIATPEVVTSTTPPDKTVLELVNILRNNHPPKNFLI